MRDGNGGRKQECVRGRGGRDRVRGPHQGGRLLHASDEQVGRADHEQQREEILARGLGVFDVQRIQCEEHTGDRCRSHVEEAPHEQGEHCGRNDERRERQDSHTPLAALAAREDVQEREVQASVRLAVHDYAAELMPGQTCQGDADRLVARESLGTKSHRACRCCESSRQPQQDAGPQLLMRHTLGGRSYLQGFETTFGTLYRGTRMFL